MKRLGTMLVLIVALGLVAAPAALADVRSPANATWTGIAPANASWTGIAPANATWTGIAPSKAKPSNPKAGRFRVATPREWEQYC